MPNYKLQNTISRKEINKLETQLYNAIILLADSRDESLEDLEEWALTEIGISVGDYRRIMRLR